MAEQYDHMQGENQDVLDHPEHNFSEMNNRGMRVPDYRGEAETAKQEVDIAMKYKRNDNSQFSDIGLNPPGKASLRNLDYNKAK